MLKRLIIAVFGISLVLAFGSVAFGDNSKGVALENTIAQPAPPNPRANDFVDARPEQPTFKKPASALRKLPSGVQNPAPPSLIYFCDVQDYSGPYWYYWTIPDAFGDDLFNTRFTVEAGFNCTLKVAHLLMISDPTVVGDPPGSWGAADLQVNLWADDGFGFPGALLESIVIPNASLPAFGYVAADFSASGWVFSDGDEYHYGWTPVGGGTLAILSDDGAGPYSGEERSSEYYLGAWGTMLNDWGVDVVFNIASERCCSEIPFSDCYAQSYWQNITYIWRTPHNSFGDTAWSMRFDVGGPETLSSVDFFVYNDLSLDPAGNNIIYVKVYDDDGSGYPGALLATATLPPASYPFFPAITSVPFAPLVLDNAFHVAISTNGTWDGTGGIDPGDSYETILSSDGTDGTGRSNGSGDPTWPGPGDWYTMAFWWGADVNFLIDVYMCRDEFSDCQTQDYYGAGDGPGGTDLAEPNGVVNLFAQKFTNAPSGAECELRSLFFRLSRLAAFDGGRPLMFTHNTLVHVAADAGGIPGGTIHTETVTPADYAAAGYTGAGFFGNLFFTRNMNVVIPSEFWVVFQSLAPIRAEGIRVGARIVTPDPAGMVGGCLAYYDSNDADEGWYAIEDLFGGTQTYDAALDVEASVCCVPFSGRVCAPPDDWSSRSHDLGRTGASQLAIEDAWCDLSVNWFADELTAGSALTMGPVIYNGRAYQIVENTSVSSSFIRVYDLYTGALVDNIVLPPAPAPAFFVENDPLIEGGFMYITGGDNRVIYKFDITTTPATLVWATAPLAAAGGPLRRANLLLVNVGGTDVLFGGTQLGRAFAINAGTGALYAGWATNPITLDAGRLVNASATDGSQLYFGTGDLGAAGDVWAINPADGSVNWKLSTAGGFQGAVVYPTAPPSYESFPQLSVEAGVVYAGCLCADVFPTDGIFYRLNAATGAVLSAVACSSPAFFNPIVDVNLIYMGTRSLWSAPNIGLPGNIFAFSKSTGAIVWNSEMFYESHLNDRSRNNGLLTCEPEPAADIIVASTEGGFVKFINSLDGSDIFNRRVDFGPGASSRPGGTAIGLDSAGVVHVLVGSNRGALVDLTKGVDRGRLEIQDFDPNVAVEFSVLTNVIYTVENIFVNTGCADLVFNAVTADEISFGSTDPGVSPFKPVNPGLLTNAALLADQMTMNSKMFIMTRSVADAETSVENDILTTSELSLRNERSNRAALAMPPYLNAVVEPFAGQVVAAGDSTDLVMDVDPSQINRGPQTFYIELNTNDADYFLNAGSAGLPNDYPQLVVTLVGGCLSDTTALEFGVGGANYQWVTNTGRLADGDWDAHGFEIDGQDAYWYQGSYVFGVSVERIAFNAADWSGSTGQEASWISIQGDPNYCDNSCKPALNTGVSLGDIWNGASYTPILGNMICKSWIDSVQDFGEGVFANWDWKNFGAPFDDSLTMGLTANTRTVGALNTPELANLTVEIFEVTERNGGNVNGWKFGENVDYDLATQLGGVADTAVVDRNISAAWTTSASNASASYAYGSIKLPFGCGYEPLKNAKALDAEQGHFIAAGGAARGDGYMDSAYIYMSLAPGEYTHLVTPAADQQIHITHIENDFGPNETLEFGVAHFGYNSGISDPWAPGGGGELAATAHLVNKWVGFGRGDVNDDEAINLGDIMTLADIVGGSVPGAIPFEHLGDVDADGDVDNADLNYLINYYFGCGPCPLGEWQF